MDKPPIPASRLGILEIKSSFCYSAISTLTQVGTIGSEVSREGITSSSSSWHYHQKAVSMFPVSFMKGSGPTLPGHSCLLA